jgi:hypothetical protein
MKNTLPLPVLPVNVLLPLPLTPSPIKPNFSLGDPEDRILRRRRRSSTFISIKNWALAVQPGPPAPDSPHSSITISPGPYPRRSSISAARDFITRRSSISHNRAPSGSSIVHLVHTPKTGDDKQPHFDLTTLGYTSVFVHIAHTPSTPSPFLLRDPYQKEQSTGLNRIKSLGMLKRTRRKSVSATSPSQQTPSRSRSHSRSKSVSASTSKKSTAHPPLPPTLTSELLLMQFADGGKLETHAKRVMQEQAREAAPSGTSKGAPLPVGVVFRDENGAFWRDEEEKLEREALLPPIRIPDSPLREWITFNPSGNGHSSPILPGMALGVGTVESEERRGSFASMASSLSLSPTNIVTHADVSAYAPPNPLSGSGASRAPSSPTGTVSTTTGMAAASGAAAQNKRAHRRRRRPAPLTLIVPSSSPNAFDDSFIPSPRAVALASLTPPGVAGRRSSTSTSGLTAPPAYTEFASTMQKENVRSGGGGGDQAYSASLAGTVLPRKTLGKKMSKLNLKSMKALFGGSAQ